MIGVLLGVGATWCAVALVAALLIGRALHGARRLADRYERPAVLTRSSVFVDHLANRAMPASAFGAPVVRPVR